MRTLVINVGKEVLTGKTVNTNLTFIARELKQIGIDVSRSFIIDDQVEEYFKVLDIADEDLVIFTGGLGPTIDDITRETVLDYYQKEVYIDKDLLDTIQRYFDRVGLTMKDTNNKQALMTKGAISLKNNNGTAPGLFFTADSKTIILLPGPPHENKPMMKQVIELLKKDQDDILYSDGFKLVGTGESWMEDKLKGFYEKHPNVSIAPYASAGEIKYIFTSLNQGDMKNCMNEFKSIFHDFIYGNLEDELPNVVVDLLGHNNLTISAAESCTGGMFAGAITSVSGSSNVINESYVTYSNEAKQKILGVSSKTLTSSGAVSETCVIEMVQGLAIKTKANVCVSISGIAGPKGGTKEKPVGLVYFGLLINGEIYTFRKVFNGNREKVRQRAVIFIFNEIRKLLIK